MRFQVVTYKLVKMFHPSDTLWISKDHLHAILNDEEMHCFALFFTLSYPGSQYYYYINLIGVNIEFTLQINN